MKNIYTTIYTKEQGRLDLNLEERNNFNKGIYHRDDGPAVSCYHEDGSVEREFYYINNKWHRTDGPAQVWYYKTGSVSSEHYYINNKRHRIDGPASIWYRKDKCIEREFYYINDKCYIKEDYYDLINEMKSLPKSLRLVHELWWVKELI